MNRSLKYLDKRAEFTTQRLKCIREGLAEKFKGENFCVVADGSYARKEASEVSDIDFYVIYKGKKPDLALKDRVSDAIRDFVPNMPSDGGPFNTLSCSEEMLSNIGGEGDSNSKTTKRILLLLEGDWLFNKEHFDEIRHKLVETYISDKTSEPQIALFLLNDFIRYYRTVCVDFNYKTVEDGKAWGIRNIKLIFSRKLLYFGGIIAVAETAHMTAQKKREKIIKLIEMSPLDRIKYVCGDDADDVIKRYSYFLEEISKPEVRKILNSIEKNKNNDNDKFRELKNEGHLFTRSLYKLLNSKYDRSHPIHRMLIL